MQRSIDYSCTVSSSVQLGKRSSQDPHVTYMNSVSVNSFLLYCQSWDTCVLIRFISSFGWKINKRLFRIWVSQKYDHSTPKINIIYMSDQISSWKLFEPVIFVTCWSSWPVWLYILPDINYIFQSWKQLFYSFLFGISVCKTCIS